MIVPVNTVKISLIETPKNDPFTRDTFQIEDNIWNVGEFSFVHDAVEYVLPKGYSVCESGSGDLCIYDEHDGYCAIEKKGSHPVLYSTRNGWRNLQPLTEEMMKND